MATPVWSGAGVAISALTLTTVVTGLYKVTWTTAVLSDSREINTAGVARRVDESTLSHMMYVSEDLDGDCTTITVQSNAPVLSITTLTLPGGSTGVAYSQTVSASAGTAPYTFAVTSGALPTGLSLNAS